MKCPNCGFNTENEAVCPVCGFQLMNQAQPEQYYTQQPDPYAQQPEQYYTQQPDPYAQQPEQYYTQQPDPYAQQPEQYYTQQPDPYAQQPEQYYTQQPDPYNRLPSEPNTQQPKPYITVSARKKPGGSKAGMIIVACILATGILMGAVISVFSAITYNKSASEIFSDNINDATVASNRLKLNDFYDDNSPRKVGETVSSSWASVTLKSVKTKKTTSGTECKFTVTVTNTSDTSYKIYDGYVVNPYDSKDNYSSISIGDATEDEDYFGASLINLTPGHTKTIVDTITVTSDIKELYAEIDMSFIFDETTAPFTFTTGYDVNLEEEVATTK
ncbi:MAG: hypothetical protein UH734_01030 [Ruminococcus sp.]|nr:hypothetical protein [Ruminococcus sp.]